MASKMKADGMQMKVRRGTSPSDQSKKMANKATSSARRETSPSSSSERQVPNYLKPTISSRTESPKTLKKPGHENTSKPSLSGRHSFDKPPVTASQMQKVLSSGPRERAPMTKSLLPASKSTVPARKPTMGTKSMSMPKAVASRAKILKTAKKVPPNNLVKKESESSDLVGGAEVHDVVVVTETQDDDKASIKEVDHCEEIEDQVDVAPLHQPETQLIEEEPVKIVTVECKDGVLLEHHEDVFVSEKEDAKVQREDVPEENILLQEEIDDIEHHEREDYNNHEEAEESSNEMGVTEVEEKPDESETKDALTEDSANGSNDDSESVKCSSTEVDMEVGEEIDSETSKPNEGQEEEGLSTRQVAVQPDGAENTTVLKNRKGNGKDSAVSNDVIAETATKLLEKRKNKVKALVGAFETVISLQEPEP